MEFQIGQIVAVKMTAKSRFYGRTGRISTIAREWGIRVNFSEGHEYFKSSDLEVPPWLTAKSHYN